MLGSGRRRTTGVKASAYAPMNRPMRVSRIAPIVALACAAACGAGAVLSSHAAEWHPPAVIAVLFAFAVLADRFAITTRTGTTLVGNLPVFVLAAALFGPAPAVAIAVAASLTQPRKDWRLVVGDLGVFATFPLVTGLAVGPSHAYVAEREGRYLQVVVECACLVAWSLNI